MKRGDETPGTSVTTAASSSASRGKGPAPAGHDVCESCLGTGEYPTDYGMVDCPDCGGSGHMPSRRIVVERRLRDVERAVDGGLRLKQDDMRWLLLEVRTLRQALRNVVALSHDGSDDTTATAQIRRTAEKALGESGRKHVGSDAPGSDAQGSDAQGDVAHGTPKG
jgi:hypothetical protein